MVDSAGTATSTSAGTATLQSTEPATGDILATLPITTAAAVAAAVVDARRAQRWWWGLGFNGRRAVLRAWAGVLARRADQLAHLVTRENGKPRADALLEVALTVEHLWWAAGRAPRVLGERWVPSGLLTANQWATLRYEPYGVVAVIGPWNYPVFTPMGSIAYALAAGNAVVFKPSEYTPVVGQWLAESLQRLTGGRPVLTALIGAAQTGRDLCAADIDKVSFTGSTATARAVMTACAQRLTPVVIEAGGNDALIVDATADLDAAAHAIVFGGVSNAGQTCVAVERVFVVAPVAEDLTDRVSRILAGRRPGRDPAADWGPMTTPEQAAVIATHVSAALAAGARIVSGTPQPASAPTPQPSATEDHPATEGHPAAATPLLTPLLLTDVPADSPLSTEETFGPVITITPVPDLPTAVARANAVRHGLGATVFSRDRAAIRWAVANLRTGMVSVNAWAMNAGVPRLSWGGVGDSGFGRIHGDDGLREFARSKAVTRQLFGSPLEIASYRRTPAAADRLSTLLAGVYGRRRWRAVPPDAR